MHMYKHKKWSK